MIVMVFDTETTSLNQPFCYDLGYLLLDTDTRAIFEKRHFVIEQVWHNLPLFSTSYYAEKRPIYVNLMRARKAELTKWGYALRTMLQDIRKYNITDAYAYNSNFDDKVFAFNCDWYKCINPLENIAIHDIMGYATTFITNSEEYKQYCKENNFLTDSGNYSQTAESVYSFITNQSDFKEQHISLYDSEIEAEILLYCINSGAQLNYDYEVKRILKTDEPKPFSIKVNGITVYNGQYTRKSNRHDIYHFVG